VRSGETTLLSCLSFSVVDTDGDWNKYSCTVNADASGTSALVLLRAQAPASYYLSEMIIDGDALPAYLVSSKIETLAVLHRRWYTGADTTDDVLVGASGGALYYRKVGATAWTALADPDVLVAAAGGVLYYMVVGGTAWTALAHPEGGEAAFTSNAWSWVQYEIAPAEPEDDPIDVLVLSNQDDGMIYIRCDDTVQAITAVTTPKKFGVIQRFNERIWGGDIATDPDMVVYSAPYDFTDWSANEEIPEDGAGDIQQPTWDGDSFTALKQLGPQLIAFRKNTIWRILGTDPGEFVWKQQYGGGTQYENTIVVDGERVLMLGDTGVLQYDGLGVQSYYQEHMADFWKTLNISALEQACACLYKGKYYLSVPTGTSTTNDAVVIYDTKENTWLLRTDVEVESWLPTDSLLYFTSVGTTGTVSTWGEDPWASGALAATPCKWVSPWIDLSRKDIRKGGWVVYLTVEGKAAGTLSISLETEKKKKTKTYNYPILVTNAKQKRMRFGGGGRRFRLHIESTGTTVWRLIGGVQIITELDED
jgi:hypothetical protein